MKKRYKKRLVGFKKDNLVYIWCNQCEKKCERFVSVEKIKSPQSGEMMHATFNGIEWALKNGFNPIFEI